MYQAERIINSDILEKLMLQSIEESLGQFND